MAAAGAARTCNQLSGHLGDWVAQLVPPPCHQVAQMFEEEDLIGPAFHLACQKHPHSVTATADLADFDSRAGARLVDPPVAVCSCLPACRFRQPAPRMCSGWAWGWGASSAPADGGVPSCPAPSRRRRLRTELHRAAAVRARLPTVGSVGRPGLTGRKGDGVACGVVNEHLHSMPACWRHALQLHSMTLLLRSLCFPPPFN